MSYAALLNHHKSAFSVRILISMLLGIKAQAAKSLLVHFEHKTNEEFIQLAKEYFSLKEKPLQTITWKQTHIKGINKQLIKFMSPAINMDSIKSYFDFGCADGLKMESLGGLLKVEEVVGLDIVESTNPRVMHYDGITFPPQLIAKTFHLITVFQVLHHIEESNLTSILDQLATILAPGGYLILRDHDCSTGWIKTLVDLEHEIHHIKGSPYMKVHTYKSAEAWKELMETRGLKQILLDQEFDHPSHAFTAVYQKSIITELK